MMKRILYIFLLAIGMATVAPMVATEDNHIATVYAVDAKAKAKAQAQREREKAKAQKAKEKAKAQREKEKAKAQREKEKQKAAAQKQREREKAQAAKAKAAAKSSTKPGAKASKPVKAEPELSPAEEKAQYMEQVAAIEKKNQRVLAYLNRDISHRLGFWGQVGYSNLFTSSIAYDQTAGTGFTNADGGFVGGGAGLGYQMRYKQLLMTVGAEFTTYNSIMGLANTPEGLFNRSYGMAPYSDVMTYHYSFAHVSERIIGGFVQLPILFGMELRELPLYWQAGLKVGMGLMGKSQFSGQLTTTITDLELIEGLEDMYNHSLVTDQPVERPANSVSLGLNLAATAEVGVNLDRWIEKGPRMRLGIFADYGLLNVNAYKPAPNAQDIPMRMLEVADPLAFPVNSALATTSAANAQVHPFLVGAKISVWFDLPRKQLVVGPMPPKPQPRLSVYAYDEETGVALGGVTVEVRDSSSIAKRKKTTKQGELKLGRVAEGEYRIVADKNGYTLMDTLRHLVEEFTYDTVRVPLRRIPAPIVYTLCMNVLDVETHQPVEAQARFTSLNDTLTLFADQAAADGFIETPLTAGDYIAHLSATGYMPKDDTLHFEQDTLDVYMQAIKKGIKVKIENLFFATNKTVILPQSEQAMADLAGFLLENAGVTIHITGHTDAVGSDEANQILSEGRANAVRQNLIDRGVAPERMTAEGKGEKEPVADNDTEEGRQLNRRVEFVITSTNGADIQQVY